MTEDEIMAEARAVAADIVNERITPNRGAAAIWRMLAENEYRCFDDLQEFVGAASQWDEVPHLHAELEADIARAARTLIG